MPAAATGNRDGIPEPTSADSADQSSHAVQRARGPFLEARSKDPILIVLDAHFRSIEVHCSNAHLANRLTGDGAVILRIEHENIVVPQTKN